MLYDFTVIVPIQIQNHGVTDLMYLSLCLFHIKKLGHRGERIRVSS